MTETPVKFFSPARPCELSGHQQFSNGSCHGFVIRNGAWAVLIEDEWGRVDEKTMEYLQLKFTDKKP